MRSVRTSRDVAQDEIVGRGARVHPHAELALCFVQGDIERECVQVAPKPRVRTRPTLRCHGSSRA